MKIYDGRSQFYQWDLNQRLTADGLNVGDEVHFSNATMREALIVKAYALEDGTIVADVPNILLQAPYPVEAFRYIQEGPSEHTIEARTFSVQKRPRPADYIYTETEVHSIEKIAEEAVKKALEGLGGTSVTVGGKVVDTFDADTKLDKVTSQRGVLYAVLNGEQITMTYAQEPQAYSIAYRTAAGQLRVGTAERDDAAVPLAQLNEILDERIGDIAAALDEVHAYAQALVNGGATV